MARLTGACKGGGSPARGGVAAGLTGAWRRRGSPARGGGGGEAQQQRTRRRDVEEWGIVGVRAGPTRVNGASCFAVSWLTAEAWPSAG